MNKLLTQEQAGEMLCISPKTLEQWRYLGKGPRFIRMSSRAVRYSQETIEAWLSGLEVRSTSEKTPASKKKGKVN